MVCSRRIELVQGQGPGASGFNETVETYTLTGVETWCPHGCAKYE